VGHPGAFLKPCEELLALCDCNNFFVSCERLFRPDLEGRPVVVLSSNDGVIISRSNEAKALGIKMGEPYFRVRSFLERRGGAVFSSNFQLYEEISARVMEVLRRSVPSIEIYSVDEAFLEVPPAGKGCPVEWARDVRAAVLKETGIPVSVGVAPAKTAAKLAAERAKKRPETGGAFALLPGEFWDDVLGEIPVEDVWGIGRRWSDFLRRRGVLTALRLRDASDDWLEKHLGIRGLRTAWELRGIRCFAIEEREKPQKSIQSSRSFSSPVRSREALAEAVTEFALAAGRRLRSQGSLAGSLSVSISTSRFRAPFYGARAEVILETPTDSDITLIKAATGVLSSIYKEERDYEKAEVCLGSLSSAATVQLRLFGKMDDRGSALSRAADRLNDEAGRRLLMPAVLLGEKEWRPRKERHSGTRLEDLEKLPVISGKAM
jgi:DNA polymerase V